MKRNFDSASSSFQKITLIWGFIVGRFLVESRKSNQKEASLPWLSRCPSPIPEAQITRTSLVLAAAALLRERGPEAVTYRKVAEWAGAASSSVGYYFDSVTELLYEAGCYNIELWIARAEKVAQAADAFSPEECRERVVDLLLEACLPDDTVSMPAHYAQLIASAEAPVVTEAYRKGREALDAAVNRILVRAGVNLTPSVVVALVDGGAVKAISEGYDVREIARMLLETALDR